MTSEPLAVPQASQFYHNIRFAEYLQWPYLSQSTLKHGKLSMAHLKAALDGERKKIPTDDMLLGSALHVAFLEPERMPDAVAKWTGLRRAGSAWEEFRLENAGKIIITENMHAKLIGMVQALRRHPCVRQWVAKVVNTEVAAVGQVMGVQMKGRCDALTSDPLVDLKKVRSCDIRTITNTVLTYGYDIQGYIYRQLFQRDRFLLICVESEPPYDVVAHELSPAFLRAGQREAEELLERYKQCAAADNWPGRSDEIVMVTPPEWAIDSGSLTIGGVEAFGDE